MSWKALRRAFLIKYGTFVPEAPAAAISPRGREESFKIAQEPSAAETLWMSSHHLPVLPAPRHGLQDDEGPDRDHPHPVLVVVDKLWRLALSPITTR